jgi:hypothetical protein
MNDFAPLSGFWIRLFHSTTPEGGQGKGGAGWFDANQVGKGAQMKMRGKK